jgi:hypothetical protein
MQIVNNKIFDSTDNAFGEWRNISNFIALSIHVIGLEHSVYIEASNSNTDPGVGGAGVKITGDLGNSDVSLSDEIAIFYDGSGAMVNPSCLAWNWIRVTKPGGSASVQTQAFLFGQNG